MKKIFTLFLALTTLSAVAKTELGTSFEDGLFKFKVTSESPATVECIKYTGTEAEVAVPASATDADGDVYTVVSTNSTFWANKRVKKVTFPETLKILGNYTCYYCDSITSVTIPESVDSIGQSVFTSNKQLQKIVIPETVKSMGKSVFGSCEKLTTVNLPKQLKILGSGVFSGCKVLTGVELPEGLLEIGNRAFMNCFKLKSLTIPASVEWIDDEFANNCDALQAITLAPGNSEFTCIDGVLYDRLCSRMLCYPAGKPDTTFTVPNTVAYLTDYAFARNTKLKHIYLGKTVTHIGVYAFLYCYGISEFTIPEYITEVPANMFYGCKNLKKITINPNAENIGSGFIAGCAALEEVYYNTKTLAKAVDASFTAAIAANATLYVPEDLVETAMTATGYKNFGKIVAYDFAGVSEIAADETNVPVEVYNMSGVKVASSTEDLPAGLYIVRQGGKTKKISVK